MAGRLMGRFKTASVLGVSLYIYDIVGRLSGAVVAYVGGRAGARGRGQFSPQNRTVDIHSGKRHVTFPYLSPYTCVRSQSERVTQTECRLIYIL